MLSYFVQDRSTRRVSTPARMLSWVSRSRERAAGVPTHPAAGVGHHLHHADRAGAGDPVAAASRTPARRPRARAWGDVVVPGHPRRPGRAPGCGSGRRAATSGWAGSMLWIRTGSCLRACLRAWWPPGAGMAAGLAGRGDDDRDPEHLAAVERARGAQPVQPDQLGGPGVVAHGQAGRPSHRGVRRVARSPGRDGPATGWPEQPTGQRPGSSSGSSCGSSSGRGQARPRGPGRAWPSVRCRPGWRVGEVTRDPPSAAGAAWQTTTVPV